MPIAIRGVPKTQNANNGNDATLTLDVITPPLINDIVIVFGGHANTVQTLSDVAGNTSGNYLQLGVNFGTEGEAIFGAWYQRMGATPDTSILCDGGGNTADGVQYGCWVISGVDTVTALDAAATTAGPTTSTDPNCPSIATATTDEWVFAMAGSNNRDTSVTAPTGYTDLLQDTRQEANDQTIAGARINAGAIDTEDPPAFTTWISGPWFAVTAAFRPAAAASVIPYASYLEHPTRLVKSRLR